MHELLQQINLIKITARLLIRLSRTARSSPRQNQTALGSNKQRQTATYITSQQYHTVRDGTWQCWMALDSAKPHQTPRDNEKRTYRTSCSKEDDKHVLVLRVKYVIINIFNTPLKPKSYLNLSSTLLFAPSVRLFCSGYVPGRPCREVGLPYCCLRVRHCSSGIAA